MCSERWAAAISFDFKNRPPFNLQLLMKERFDNLIIGIDPGPYPGLAVFADGVMMEAYECPVRENLSDEVRSIVSTYCFHQ